MLISFRKHEDLFFNSSISPHDLSAFCLLWLVFFSISPHAFSAFCLHWLFSGMTRLRFAHEAPPLQCPGRPIKLNRFVGSAKWWRLLRLLWRSSSQVNIPRGRENIFSLRFSFGRQGHQGLYTYVDRGGHCRHLLFQWDPKYDVLWEYLRMTDMTLTCMLLVMILRYVPYFEI